MANFEGSIGTPDGRFNLMVEYSISQSIENNYSDITATGYVKRNVSSVYPYNGYGGDGVLTIDGDSKSETVPYDLRSDGYKQIMSHSKRVYHNSDGTKGITISFSFNGNLSSYYPNGSISQYITLPTIARASEIACSSPYIGDTAIINISKKSSNFKSTVWYTFGNLNNTIATKTSENVISFNTNSVKSQLYSQIQNSQSGSGTMYCETFNGNTSIGTKSCTFYLYAKESDCKPNLTVTVVDTNSDVTALLGSNTKFLRYLSKPQVTLTPTAKYSSSITNYTISANNENHNNSTYTFNTLENNTITGYVKDSRGFTKTVTETLDMIDYIKLHINNFDVSRPEGLSTQAILNIDGAWYNDDFTTNLSNTLTMQLSYKLSSANTWTTYGTLNPTLTGNTFKITNLSLSGTYDVDEEYQFKIVISDEIDGMEQIETLHKGQEIISIGDEKVWLYGDLFINDCSLVNKYSTSEVKMHEKWIDGKTIYRKVIYISSLPGYDSGLSEITYSTGIVNMKTPIKMDGIYYDKNNSQASWAINNTYNYRADRKITTRLKNDGTAITISTSGSDNFSNYEGYVILEYTKTTD